MFKFATQFALSLALLGVVVPASAATPRSKTLGKAPQSRQAPHAAQLHRPAKNPPAISGGGKSFHKADVVAGQRLPAKLTKQLPDKLVGQPLVDVKQGVAVRGTRPVKGLDSKLDAKPMPGIKPVRPLVRPLDQNLGIQPVVDLGKPIKPFPHKPLPLKPVVNPVKPIKPFPLQPIVDPVRPFNCGTMPPYCPPSFPPYCPPRPGCGPLQGCWPRFPGCGFGGFGGYGGGLLTPSFPVSTPSYPMPVDSTPVYSASVAAAPVVTVPVVEAALPAPDVAAAVDLVVDGIILLEAGDIGKNVGPLVQVTVSNRGTAPAGKFALGVYASLQAEPNQGMIPAGEMVEELAAGASRTVEVRLPVEVLGMTAAGSTIKETFKQLFVVADVENTVVESDKQNNILPMKRDQLALE